jgi:hypothetical protein
MTEAIAPKQNAMRLKTPKKGSVEQAASESYFNLLFEWKRAFGFDSWVGATHRNFWAVVVLIDGLGAAHGHTLATAAAFEVF